MKMVSLPAKYAFAAITLILAAGCRKEQLAPDSSVVPSGAPLVTVVYSPDALGDRSYNDLIYTGVERAALSRGLRTMQLSPSTASEGLAILQEYFKQMREPRDTVRRLLIVAGTEYDDFLRESGDALKDNPLSERMSADFSLIAASVISR